MFSVLIERLTVDELEACDAVSVMGVALRYTVTPSVYVLPMLIEIPDAAVSYPSSFEEAVSVRLISLTVPFESRYLTG